jgi:hypothetical protein
LSELVAVGTLLPRANAAACPQLAKADFASSSQHVREGQRIGELEAEIEALQRQAMALGVETRRRSSRARRRVSGTSGRKPRATIHSARNSCAGCATSVMSKGATSPTSFAIMVMMSNQYPR